MARHRVVFLGSKPVGHTCLQILLDRAADIDAEVIAVGTRRRTEWPAGDVGALADGVGIPVLQHLDELPPCDAILSVQYHEILRPRHLAQAAVVAANLHMAPLPEYRGSNQFSYAIDEGAEEFGTTLHVMDAGVDCGDILFQTRFPIPPHCWVEDLYKLAEEASVQLFSDALGPLLAGDYTRTPQASLIPRYGTAMHYRREIDTLKQIDLSWSAERIGQRIRATAMPGFEQPYCTVAGRRVHFVPEEFSAPQ